jgi:hypothetical protein
MAVLGELLFYRRDQVDLDTVLRARSEHLRKKIDGLPDRTFHEKTDHEIAQNLADSEAIEPLKLDFDNAQAAVSEVQVEVHDDYGFDRGPVRVAGLRATKSIPFTGDRELWRLRTNPFDLNPPRGEVRDQNLVIGIEVPVQQADQAKRYIDDTITALPEWLGRSRAQVEAYNAGIAARTMPIVQQRRARLGQAADLLKKLQG